MSLWRVRALRLKSAGISNPPCCPEYSTVAVGVVGIAIGMGMGSAVGMTIAQGIEELREHLERGPA